ncbi:hypothetical protein HQ563_15155 [bacterium]|nr:hypothetical protein [bacterium]
MEGSVDGSSSYKPDGYMVCEDVIGGEPHCLAQTGPVALFKRGQFREAEWNVKKQQ